MMTRKDYIATAEILKRFGDDDTMDFEDLVSAFSKMFLADNDRFNTRIFYSACYGEDN